MVDLAVTVALLVANWVVWTDVKDLFRGLEKHEG